MSGSLELTVVPIKKVISSQDFSIFMGFSVFILLKMFFFIFVLFFLSFSQCIFILFFYLKKKEFCNLRDIKDFI